MTPELVCPECRVGLLAGVDELACPGACARVFPVVAGIPDLRLVGDGYLSLEADREKALALAEVPGDLETLLHAYWACTPEVPPELARRYIVSALDATRRSQRQLDRLGEIEGRLLDIGCGTGGLVVAAARRGAEVTGVDTALRWLVVARRRLQEQGTAAQLVAADGATLPFRPGAFETVVCIEVLEHALDQPGLLHGWAAAAAPHGRSYAIVANRYSMLPEPSVGLWMVGYLPRRWAPGYVRWRRHTRYRQFRALSHRELRRMAEPRHAIRLGPAVLPSLRADPPPVLRAVDRAYHRLRSSPTGAAVLSRVGPYLEVLR